MKKRGKMGTGTKEVPERDPQFPRGGGGGKGLFGLDC